ncbi:STAS/SEC14 domain-containing protein [Sphingomonas quercus]|uniref:STAS/SEC14 domain-containing protein n=1 Tax=Sphingomonas quercus TaxID=2842451 RepID=A0ABS6BF44_9SPHN|nr:STAS/SEC14 domain-containing protein [Sphingomonas quercus]MBU3076451.1 STAS/SEC14 domain-containing protein [Sphingomonas quercus]
MIEILPAPAHVLSLRLSGTLTQDDLERTIDDIEARLKRFDRIGVVADVTAFEDIGLRAGLKDIAYSFGKIMEWRRFPREAVIADRQWVRAAIGFIDPLVPFVTVKSFAPEESDAALAWAGGFDPGRRD